MRARSHRYPSPEKDDIYTDTTYYHKEDKYLDVAFQRLKIFNPKMYPELSSVKKLFIDHNNLKTLPEPKSMPNLEELTCSVNNLVSIPFYPNLTFLNIAHNNITDCSAYNGTMIEHFDCSYNPSIKLNFTLPSCKQLYINDCGLESIDLDLYPNINYLDCSNNKLTKISGGTKLIELHIQYNLIKELPEFPSIVRINADHNLIKELRIYPDLVNISVAYNQLIKIPAQPSLRKLIANNNMITDIGKMSKLELIDLAYNKLTVFTLPEKLEYVSLQFNPLTKLELTDCNVENLKELQINFETYKYIYANYYHKIDAVNVQTNKEKLEMMLKKLNKIFDDRMIEYIFKNFSRTKFKNRAIALFRVTLKLYWKYFSKSGAENLHDLIRTKEFKYLLTNITKLYYKTIVVTLYFHDYC